MDLCGACSFAVELIGSLLPRQMNRRLPSRNKRIRLTSISPSTDITKDISLSVKSLFIEQELLLTNLKFAILLSAIYMREIQH